MYKKLPKLVGQSTNWSCWAAALESWLDVTPYRSKQSQQTLIDAYATHEDGGLDPLSSGETADRDFESLAGDLSIAYTVVKGSALTLDFIDEKLKTSHVLLMYNLAPGVAHANVIYGIGMPNGKEMLISVMEPSPGIYVNRPLNFYSGRSAIIVGWAEAI